MQKIIVTGSNGLIGTRLMSDLADQFSLVGFDYSNPDLPVDITKIDSLKVAFEKHQDAVAVVHLAAYTDVSGAFLQSGDKNASAYQINVLGTQNVASCAKEFGQQLVHMSTAYVFSGDKNSPYTEEDDPSPIEWYGKTKAEAEELLVDVGGDYTILRIDQPFRNDSFSKLDTLHRVIKGIKDATLYPQFTNHYFGPTYIPDLVQVIGEVIRQRITGLYHASQGESWSDFEFAVAVNRILGLGGEIKAGDLDEYLKTTNRPYQRSTALSCERLRQKLTDFKWKTVEEAIALSKTGVDAL